MNAALHGTQSLRRMVRRRTSSRVTVVWLMAGP
jgi:hypothetical protein